MLRTVALLLGISCAGVVAANAECWNSEPGATRCETYDALSRYVIVRHDGRIERAELRLYLDRQALENRATMARASLHMITMLRTVAPESTEDEREHMLTALMLGAVAAKGEKSATFGNYRWSARTAGKGELIFTAEPVRN